MSAALGRALGSSARALSAIPSSALTVARTTDGVRAMIGDLTVKAP